MKELMNNFVTKNHNYNQVLITDLEGEYINCPIYELLYNYKKILS